MSGRRATLTLALLIAMVMTVAVVMLATGAPGESSPDRLATLTLNGTAEVDGRHGVRRLDSGGHGVSAGDRIKLLTGDGVLRLSDDRSLELRGGPDGSSRVQVDVVPVIEGGDVLAVAGEGGLTVEAGGARLSLVDGAARVSRATGTTFVVYDGRAGLTSGGRVLEGGLPPLRQVVVTNAGMVPLSVSPLSFGEPPDPWDRRFLGEAIDLQAILERRSIGFTTLLRGDFTPDVFFYQAVLPGLLHQPSFDQALLDGQNRPVGETLVGAAMSLVGREGDFATRWGKVFGLRSDGAGWGVVASDQDAPRAALLSALDGAVDRSPLLFAPPSTEPVFQPVPAPVRQRPPVPPPDPTPLPLPIPIAPPPAPLPVQPPAPVMPGRGEGDTGILDPLVDPLVDLLDGVLEGLGGVTRRLL